MSESVGQDKWDVAQKFEKAYWGSRCADPVGFISDLYGNFDLAQLIQRSILTRPFDRVLEIGVGGLGIGLLWMFPNSSRRVGVDPIPPTQASTGLPLVDNLVSGAQKGNEYRQAQGEQLPFETGSFDLVICNNVLDHVMDPGAVLREITRVTCTGGVVALGVDTHSQFGHLVSKFKRMLHPNAEDYLMHPHDFLFSRLSAALEQGGLEVFDAIAPTWKGKIAGRKRRSTWVCVKK